MSKKQPSVEIEPWCDIDELADHTGLSVSTLQRLTRAEDIPSTVINGRVLFKKSRVDTALDAISDKAKAERAKSKP